MKLKFLKVKFEVKEVQDTDDGFFRFEGLASTFGNLDLTQDVMEKGAFLESLSERMPIILWQHRSSEPIGMPETIYETDEGLYIKVRLPKDDTLVSGRVIPQIKVGSIRTMSIGYVPIKQSYDDESKIRRLIKVDLLEVSLVTFPANPMAKVTGFKSAQTFIENLNLSDEEREQLKFHLEAKQISVEDLKFLEEVGSSDLREFEKSLRESGLFSKQAAIKLSSYMKGSESSDSGGDYAEFQSQLKNLESKLDTSELDSLFKNLNSKFGE